MMGFWFFTTQFLQGVLGFRPSQAGLAFLPATLPNFAAAIAVPWLTRRLGNGRVLATGLTLALAGMAWLSRATVDSHYLVGVALPMVLIGLGQGLTLGPLTVAGVAGVDAKDAGAASGAVNAAHQLGGSLGLSVLIVVFAAAGEHALDGRALLAQRISSTLDAGTTMLALSLLAVLTLILPVRAVVRENFLITDQAKGKQ
jgi:MFS family permease